MAMSGVPDNTNFMHCVAICLCCPQAYASALKQAQDEGQSDPPISVGFTYELCAGIIDKKKSLQQIAAEEVGKVAQWVSSYAMSLLILSMFIC